ncbi:hypothetical protein ACJJTC_007359 [Scirpophaga incertulas]
MIVYREVLRQPFGSVIRGSAPLNPSQITGSLSSTNQKHDAADRQQRASVVVVVSQPGKSTLEKTQGPHTASAKVWSRTHLVHARPDPPYYQRECRAMSPVGVDRVLVDPVPVSKDVVDDWFSEGFKVRVTEAPWVAPEHWPIHDFLQNVRVGRPPYTGLSSGNPGITGSVGDNSRGGWEGTMRGWAAGALLLAAVLLLVRALERCLHRKLFKEQGGSDEWPTPNVIATSGDYSSGIREGDDLPPPYAAVTSSPTDKPIEEPPPPYSACYFANPKDMPTVHFYRRRDSNEAGPSFDTSNDNPEVKEETVQCEVVIRDEHAVNETRSDQSSDVTEDSRNDLHNNARAETSNMVYNV